jgi:hypothetical protein
MAAAVVVVIMVVVVVPDGREYHQEVLYQREALR